jgi:dsRNA-specific ribonuclease
MEWDLKKYRDYIYKNIASRAIPESIDNYESKRKKLVGKKTMPFWVQAVTHPSFDPNGNGNYEVLEYVGDEIMAYVLADMTDRANESIDPRTLTDLKNGTLLKKQQSIKSEEIGLPTFLRSRIPTTQGIKEDLLEAMFGCLLKVGDKVFGKGNGIQLCYNVMIDLYSDVARNVSNYAHRNIKQELKEIGDKLGWWEKRPGTIDDFGVPIENRDRFNNITSYTLTYTLTPNARSWLLNRGYKVVNNVFAQKTRNTKEETITATVVEALYNLKNDYGVTWESATAAKQRVPSKSFLDRLHKEGYSDFDFSSYESGDDQYVQLKGQTKDGHLDILVTAVKNKKERMNYEAELMKIFSDGANRDDTYRLKVST